MKRIMIDPTKCTGCKNCVIACMQSHRKDEGDTYNLNLTDPSNESRNYIHEDGKGGYLPLFCRHCDQAECVTTCMSGAMQKDSETGHVRYNEERCGACFMCVMNCPYGLNKPDFLTKSKVVKCDFCIDDDEDPNCVKSCPVEAITIEEVTK